MGRVTREASAIRPVSYTHLDVYKRQGLPWPIISASSRAIRAASSQKVWGRKAMIFAATKSHSLARGSKTRSVCSISHQAGLFKVLAEHGFCKQPADDGSHDGGQKQYHQHPRGGQRCQGVYIVCGHPLLRDLLQEDVYKRQGLYSAPNPASRLK